MNKSLTPLNDRISALADGALAPDQLDGLLTEMVESERGLQAWHLYHLSGDVLRNATLAPGVSELAFWERLQVSLAAEPVRPTVAIGNAQDVPLDAVGDVQPQSVHSANNSSWAWVAGLAGTAILGVLSMAVWTQTGPGNGAQLAVAPAVAVPVVVLAGDAPQVMLRDPQLDALMAAHQQLGGHSAWQMPSGFLRNATYERPAR
jgi:sigma-E factor negative regulatory protein RseA